VRARAGRFWARTGDFKAATEQSLVILGAEPDNAAGLYLQAEGLLADGKLDLARRTFQKAADYDPQAQYFDGLGRANELLWHQGEDTRFQEDALRAYGRAIDLDDKDIAEQHLKRPRMFNPQLGRGRLMVERSDFARALEPLDAARAIKPDDPDVAYLLGVALNGVKRYKEAAAWLVKANQLKPRAESYKLLGEIYGNDDQPGPAAASFGQAVELALAQEKKTGQQVEWLTDMLYEFWVIETARDDRAGIKRIGNMFLNRNPKNPTKVDEVRRSLLSLGQ
jgi:tetratricopeptide (TPR) repeat protein